MAGGLTLALGGLAAVAGAQSQCGGPVHMVPPQPVGSAVYYKDCGAPPVPACAPVGVVYTVHQPPAPTVPPVPPPPAPEPSAPVVPAVSTPAELPVPLPAAAAEKKAKPEKKPEAKDGKKPELTAKDEQTLELTLPAAAVEPAKPAATPADPPKPQPLPVAPEPARPAAPPPPEPPAAAPPAHADPLLSAPQPAAPAVVEKKLKVMLHMGDDRPRFEVRDGDEVYLKVVCDKVDVKSPSDRGEAMSVLKAAGRVAFVTPGGDGECEELSVMPGTGQVTVTGKVSFKYNWGKVETTVSGDRMTFRLGSAPGQAPATPAAVPATFRATR